MGAGGIGSTVAAVCECSEIRPAPVCTRIDGSALEQTGKRINEEAKECPCGSTWSTGWKSNGSENQAEEARYWLSTQEEIRRGQSPPVYCDAGCLNEKKQSLRTNSPLSFSMLEVKSSTHSLVFVWKSSIPPS